MAKKDREIELLKCQVLCKKCHDEKSALEKSGLGGPGVKLTPESVKQIREKWESGISCYKLAKEYQVDSKTIWTVVHYISWKHT